MTHTYRIEHPRIYIDASGNYVDALAIRNGNIIAIGEDAYTYGREQIIRPTGPCIMPALADAHIHLWGSSLRAHSISLRGIVNSNIIYSTLKEKNSPDRDWIFAHDWDQHQWTDSDQLSLKKLDALFPTRPLILRRIDGHALWVNSVTLRRVGIESSTGLLLDHEMMKVLKVAPATTLEDDRTSFLNTSDQLLNYGITSAHPAWVENDRVGMLKKLRLEKKLPLRIHAMLAGTDPNNDEMLEGTPFIDPEAWLNFACVKFFADGALGSQGAHIFGKYKDGTHGEIVDNDSILDKRMLPAARKGWQPAIHAIGDQALHRILNAFAKLSTKERRAARPRIEHLQMIEDADLNRLENLIASIQPIHRYSDCEWADDVLTPMQSRNLFRWKELQTKMPICGGSDYPIEDPNPWHGISVAISRAIKNKTTRDGKGFTNQEALAMYTKGPAYAAFWEHKLGQLKVGYVADFIVPNLDPFHASADEIWDTQNTALWLNGEQKY